jgi:preprotein translocase subunit SecE
MNRELRRLQAKEEERLRERRARVQPKRRRQRTGIRQFFREVRTELKRVAWPSRREVMIFTVVTIITAGFVTLYTFGVDFGLKRAMLTLLELR